MAGYTEFFVGDMRTGQYTSKDPWLAPQDAFPTLLNRFVERGILKRRRGNRELVSSGLQDLPVVGFGSIQFSGYHEVLACTTRRVYHLFKDGEITDLSKTDVFTGDEDDYFQFQEYAGSLYFCNGVDPIRKHTPNYASTYTLPVMDTGDVTIQTCRFLLTFKNRLLIIGPKIGGVWFHNRLYFTDINTDNVSSANWVQAQTDDTAVSAGYVGDVPVVFFTKRVYHILYTFNSDTPFAFQRKTFDFGAAARMGTAEMKDRLGVVGPTSLFGYDGFQGAEYDIPRRDLTESVISKTKIVNTFAHRLKTRNYMAVTYTRVGQTDHDRILYFNLDEGNFSESDIAVNCLFSVKGYWLHKGATPGNFFNPPRDEDYQEFELGGTKDGKILRLDYGRTDVGVNIASDVLSAKLNPFQKAGRKVKFGWLRLLINAPDTQGLEIKLYKNDSTTAFKTFNLYSKGLTNHWQSIYADGEVGDYFRVGIVDIYGTVWTGPDFDIHGMLFGFKPAGRLGEQTQFTDFDVDTDSDLITTNWRWFNDNVDLHIQRLITGTWTTKFTILDFWGEKRLSDDGSDLLLQENRGDGNWVTKRKWTNASGFAWAENGNNLELQVGGIPVWILNG